MRILLTNHYLNELGGTEMWTVSMAQELDRRGHDVSVFTFTSDPEIVKLFPETVDVWTGQVWQTDFDLCLVNHNTCLGYLQHKNVQGKKVFTSHGPSHRLEMAVPGADEYVGVSEEVVATMAANGLYGDVIRNPFDLDKFKPTFKSVPVHNLSTVMVMCKSAEACHIAKEACMESGLMPVIAHRELHPVSDVAERMPYFTYAITSGRGVYEAMACGVKPMIYSIRDGVGPVADGWVTPENISTLAQVNCSGRKNSLPWKVDDIVEALRNPPDYAPAKLREWVEENHDIKRIAKAYLAKAYINYQDSETLHICTSGKIGVGA